MQQINTLPSGASSFIVYVVGEKKFRVYFHSDKMDFFVFLWAMEYGQTFSRRSIAPVSSVQVWRSFGSCEPDDLVLLVYAPDRAEHELLADTRDARHLRRALFQCCRSRCRRFDRR